MQGFFESARVFPQTPYEVIQIIPSLLNPK